MHVLVCVEPTYFKNTENYVNQKQWIQFWKKAMKLDYDPNVKVQMIRPKNKYKSDIQSAIDETAKYPVKDTDFMTDDEEKNLKRFSGSGHILSSQTVAASRSQVSTIFVPGTISIFTFSQCFPSFDSA